MESENTISGLGGVSPPSIMFPPGFASVLTDHIYANSFIQIPEVSVCAALALLAGLTGRAYRTPTGMDLAQYMILVANSGIGKDAIHEGIPGTIRAAGFVAGLENIVKQADFVSGAALHATILKSPGFINLQGEFGRKLKRMANPTDAPMQDLRTKFTKLYGTSFIEAKLHSKEEDCIPGVPFPAFSFLGETTPRTFLECLTPDMMEDGFLSRFLVISYDGPRPPSNKERGIPFPDNFQKYWLDMLTHCARYHDAFFMPDPIIVGYKNYDAQEKLERFEEVCRQGINETKDDFQKAIYNRAHLKALKIASQLAVADNFQKPEIDLGHATWGITTVRRDIDLFLQHQRNGDIGNSDHSRLQKLSSITKDYFLNGPAASYKVPSAMRENGIIPRMYLQRRITGVAVFENQKLGASALLDQTLRAMVDNGYLMEVQKDKMVEAYSFFGKCYRLVSLP